MKLFSRDFTVVADSIFSVHVFQKFLLIWSILCWKLCDKIKFFLSAVPVVVVGDPPSSVCAAVGWLWCTDCVTWFSDSVGSKPTVFIFFFHCVLLCFICWQLQQEMCTWQWRGIWEGERQWGMELSQISCVLWDLDKKRKVLTIQFRHKPARFVVLFGRGVQLLAFVFCVQVYFNKSTMHPMYGLCILCEGCCFYAWGGNVCEGCKKMLA